MTSYLQGQFNATLGDDESASYRGVLDIPSNDPDLSSITKSVGDWWYVSVPGNYLGEDWKLHDIAKWNGTDIQRVPTSENWEYLVADESTEISGSLIRNVIDYQTLDFLI